MKFPNELKMAMISSVTKSLAFWIVGLGLIVWNAVWGPESLATFTVGLTLCGIPAVAKLDNLIKILPSKIIRPPEEEEKP